MQAAARKAFILHGKALLWAEPNARTCNECGSCNHLIRNCKEATKKQSIQNTKERFMPIYRRYKVVSMNKGKLEQHIIPPDPIPSTRGRIKGPNRNKKQGQNPYINTPNPYDDWEGGHDIRPSGST